MTLRKLEVVVNSKRKHQIALCGEVSFGSGYGPVVRQIVE
jgi:hypothetical protein